MMSHEMKSTFFVNASHYSISHNSRYEERRQIIKCIKNVALTRSAIGKWNGPREYLTKFMIELIKFFFTLKRNF